MDALIAEEWEPILWIMVVGEWAVRVVGVLIAGAVLWWLVRKGRS